MMQKKSAIELLVVVDGRSLGSSLLEENLRNELGERVTRRCGVSQTASDA